MANGAASLGRKVTMFFTFWGLNILRKPEKVHVGKSVIEKMFGMMMPRGSRKLGLSRMNMFGAGSKMIRGIMKSKGISSLEELIEAGKVPEFGILAVDGTMTSRMHHPPIDTISHATLPLAERLCSIVEQSELGQFRFDPAERILIPPQYLRGKTLRAK